MNLRLYIDASLIGNNAGHQFQGAGFAPEVNRGDKQVANGRDAGSIRVTENTIGSSAASGQANVFHNNQRDRPSFPCPFGGKHVNLFGALCEIRLMLKVPSLLISNRSEFAAACTTAGREIPKLSAGFRNELQSNAGK